VSARLGLLFAHCGDLGIEVEWAHMGRRRGEYLDDRRVIRLNPGLTTSQLTATLAHEVGHAIFGDRCSTPANERRAWELGASLIITPAQYAAAEEMVGCHTGALATELEVTPVLIEAWRRWYRKRRPVEVSRLTAPELSS
jgi:hypothetical protein